MKNIILFLLFALIVSIAILKGTQQIKQVPHKVKKTVTSEVPHIGRVQILNGCGSSGIAHKLADYLRACHFDVKNIDNAENWNYEETLVISRTLDTTVAVQVAEALNTDKIVLIRNQETRYDVTVIIGNDYRELKQ